ncbi:AIPR family protein [Caldimonas tepidiphila]|uniref:AIPR family protein n=1 Tax=Caldimonas tepidiphila TaxID=2315841 RepID=UPI000E5B57DB|nr:AIPR family protein [Caldimonas tepidiphila]
MELSEFLRDIQGRVRAEIEERVADGGSGYPHAESVFTEIVMQHMADIGMTYNPEICHVSMKAGNSRLRLSGWSLSEDGEQLDLFVSLYSGEQELASVPDSDTVQAGKHCLNFLTACVDGKLLKQIDASNEAYALILSIRDAYATLDQVRVFVLTDRHARSKNFASKEISGKLVRLEVMDIERLHRHLAEGKPRDELVVNFEDVCGSPLPCVYMEDETSGYDYALTAIPGEALRLLYERFSTRLLEANVRSFLNTTNKVNKGIRETLQRQPERFLAYNNGIVLVADEAGMRPSVDGAPGIAWLKGMQIVNGGQTTASIYFAKRRNPDIDLSRVRVPAKVIVLRSQDGTAEETLVSDISRYANSQTAVKVSDLSANQPFHVELEKVSQSVYCPDGTKRWFYERASGSYTTLLSLKGRTPAQLRKLKDEIPSTHRITKTDLAKYLNAWEQLPHIVSKGSQKNFNDFMDALVGDGSGPADELPDANQWKRMVAKTILFKRVSGIVRPKFLSFQANVAAYLVSLIAHRLGDRLNLDRIWQQQDLSPRLKEQVGIWAVEVNKVLHESANGRMVSEWAKKQECWEAVRKATYSPVVTGIPELKAMRLEATPGVDVA